MRRLASILAATLCTGLIVTAIAGSGAVNAALVAVNGITLRAAASFTPTALPRHRYAPVNIWARASIRTTGPGAPQALRRLRIDFSRNGKVVTSGLPVCRRKRLTGTDPATARARCRGALVATGKVTAGIEPPDGGRLRISSPLSIFNGPRAQGSPTVLIHAHALVPYPETYVVSAPLLKPRRGSAKGFRTTVEIPEIADGFGYLTSASIRIDRQWRDGVRRLGYAMARCPDSRLGAHGRFEFADGTVIDGTIFRFCRGR